jgi:glycosyltransferase involved in cell wall biosynthesis
VGPVEQGVSGGSETQPAASSLIERIPTPLELCMITHNPRREVLNLVLDSIVSQTVDKSAFQVLIVDNCSNPPLETGDFGGLESNRIRFRIVKESRLGESAARVRAIKETSGPWVLFVDDDNELSPDFIKNGLKIIESHPELGCFGGKLLMPSNLVPRVWARNLLGYLGIRDFGSARISAKENRWGRWEPAGGGAFVHRTLLERYLEWVERPGFAYNLGRIGATSLASCDDSLLMRGSYELDRESSYEPTLSLWHHLNPKRFRFRHLRRLMFAYGRSSVALETLLETAQERPRGYANLFSALGLATAVFMKELRVSPRYAACMASYHLGAYAEWKRRV